MTRVSRRGNVRAIRSNLPIPSQREEDLTCSIHARLAASWLDRAHKLAQTEPDSKDHRMALHMAGIAEKLPRNNLRLLVTPITPRQEWFDEAWRRWRVAHKAHDLANSRWSLAYCLDQQDAGNRHHDAQAECDRTRAELDVATEDALRTPTVRKADAVRKQNLIGKRAWAEQYRPDWQALVDQDLARFPSKPRKAREVPA